MLSVWPIDVQVWSLICLCFGERVIGECMGMGWARPDFMRSEFLAPMAPWEFCCFWSHVVVADMILKCLSAGTCLCNEYLRGMWGHLCPCVPLCSPMFPPCVGSRCSCAIYWISPVVNS